jgi:hypothetical protein
MQATPCCEARRGSQALHRCQQKSDERNAQRGTRVSPTFSSVVLAPFVGAFADAPQTRHVMFPSSALKSGSRLLMIAYGMRPARPQNTES